MLIVSPWKSSHFFLGKNRKIRKMQLGISDVDETRFDLAEFDYMSHSSYLEICSRPLYLPTAQTPLGCRERRDRERERIQMRERERIKAKKAEEMERQALKEREERARAKEARAAADLRAAELLRRDT